MKAKNTKNLFKKQTQTKKLSKLSGKNIAPEIKKNNFFKEVKPIKEAKVFLTEPAKNSYGKTLMLTTRKLDTSEFEFLIEHDLILLHDKYNNIWMLHQDYKTIHNFLK